VPEARVAITGLGVVTPAGIGIEELWKGLLEGRSGLRTIAGFDASAFPCSVGGELVDFSARNYMPRDYRKAIKVMARDIQIAVAAADMAFRDSGIITKGIDPAHTNIDSSRLACNIGAGLLCSDLNELGTAVSTAVVNGKFDMKAWGTTGMGNLTPLWLLKYLPNMLSCHVTIIHQCKGPSNTITCSDASGHLAVGEATRLIARGGADAAVAGGAESKLNPMGLLREQLLGRLNTQSNADPARACRPFDVSHAGAVIGEGGGLVILENLERAVARKAAIHAEVVGAGAACDPAGYEVTIPNAGRLDLAVRKAMADAGIQPADVDLIVAHGTGVPAEDELEARAWQEVMGADLARIPAVSLTGATGSMAAGGGGVAIAVGAKALREQTVPPTVNWEKSFAGCGLNLAPEARKQAIRHVVIGAFSIGGQSGACVLRRYEEKKS
jgi:3-oxoacyl-[acyl-carrier-protein] synthase II